jgi:hypothetical protein
MSITFGKAKRILQPYCGASGKAFNSKELDEFTWKILQYVLITGSPGAEMLFDLCAHKGQLTLPYELEVPLKVMINGSVGGVMDRWFDFRSRPDNCDNYLECANLLIENPNTFFTVYDGPSEFQIGVKGNLKEDVDAHAIFSGSDITGREIYTQHQGSPISGEYLDIKCNTITWSNVFFSKLSGFKKTPTNGYVTAYWRDRSGMQGFLSDYSPVEEAPSYRRFKLNIPNCPEYAKISIIGRTRLKEKYAENDRIPFDTLYTVEVAGQQAKAQATSQPELAQANDIFLQKLVERGATHKNLNNGKAIEVFYHTSGGTIRGIVPKNALRGRRW